jgi:type IV pilus assembly protein PilC
MIYPVVVISIAVLIVTGIMYYVIPKFQEIFNDFDVELPGLTLWLVDASKWVAGNASEEQSVPGAVWIIISPFLVFLFYKLIRITGPGKMVTDVVFARLPVLGPLIRKTSVARFTRTLGTLISAGVPILEAITITKDTSGNYIYETALTKVHDSIREGESFSGPLESSKVVDPIVVNMIDVGEETGDLDVMLMKIADNYDEEVDVAVASLLSLLEPFMVVILGGIVGTIVLALFLPLVKMIESVSQ